MKGAIAKFYTVMSQVVLTMYWIIVWIAVTEKVGLVYEGNYIMV